MGVWVDAWQGWALLPASLFRMQGISAGAPLRRNLKLPAGALTPPSRTPRPGYTQAITNLTGFPVECASLPPAWQVDSREINDQVPGWGSA